MEHIENDLYKIREKLINTAIVTSGIYVLFGLGSSLIRIYNIGWHPIFAFHCLLAVLIVILNINRNKIPLQIKTHIFFGLLLAIPLLGMIDFRIASGLYWFVGVECIVTAVYGVGWGLLYSGVFTLLFSVIAFLHLQHILHPFVDFNSYTNQTTVWVAHLIGLLFVSIIVIQTINLFLNYFIETLKKSKLNEHELEKALKALSASEKKYRSLFEGSIDPILIVDKDFKITDCNQSYLNLVGYELSELIGKKYSYGLPNQDFDWDDYFVALSKQPSGKSVEIETQHKDGYYIPIEATPYIIEDNSEMYLWGVVRDLRTVKSLERAVFSAMVTAEEKERERYAKELHDGLGPLLSTALIYVNAVGDETDRNAIKEYSQRGYEIIKDATSVIREISNNLSPIILSEYGLAHAVRSFIEKAQFATKIKFSISDKTPQRFEPTVEFTLYRVLVELINNSIKYSNAKQVSIVFSNEDALFKVRFEDDGDGFDYKSIVESNRGFGLLNLQTRIHKIDGKYLYETQPNQGVRVTITLKKN